MHGADYQNRSYERNQDDRCVWLRSGCNWGITLTLAVFVAVILATIAFTVIRTSIRQRGKSY
jgi:hypothetical protein